MYDRIEYEAMSKSTREFVIIQCNYHGLCYHCFWQMDEYKIDGHNEADIAVFRVRLKNTD
jgi:hypothetical protein